MNTILKEVTLVYEDEKSNKIWRGIQTSEGVLCEWGRNDGSDLQSKMFEGENEEFIDKKVESKLKKGYELI